jgi:hypothetical protein
MKSVMSAAQRSSSRSVTATPWSASQSCPPENVRASPITSAPIPNWRTSPEQYQHGDSVVTITVLR